MSGVWKRSYGRPTKAPPDERGGNRHGRPNATAPHPDSTEFPYLRAGRRQSHGRGQARYCRRLGVHLTWIGDLGGFWDETDFHETRDTGFLLARLEELWQRVPRYKPLSIGVVLLDLVPCRLPPAGPVRGRQSE